MCERPPALIDTISAGAICVSEAGGRVTDITGKELDFAHGIKLEQNRGIVATNGGVHDAVVDAIMASLGDRVASL